MQEPDRNVGGEPLIVRDIPYPYRAMLAICSDLDETRDADTYLTTSRFLNSRAKTRFGQGLGLEVGNSMYFHMADGEFSYWNATDDDREQINCLMRAGFVDAIHSFGDTAVERSQCASTLEHLDKAGCKLKVWIDHAIAPSNFGPDIMKGRGDVPSSKVYHADLAFAYGIEYVWLGRVTSVIGQDCRPRFRGIWQPRFGHGAILTVGKELAKHGLAALGHRKYRSHIENSILRPVTLRNGQRTYEFLRSNSHPLGVSHGDNAAGIRTTLSAAVLDGLEERNAKSILYTHLGKKIDSKSGFARQDIAALEELATRMSDRRILMLTTRRLLDYCLMLKTVQISTSSKSDSTDIHVTSGAGDKSCSGLTFEVPASQASRVFVDGRAREVAETANSTTGRTIVSIPFLPLAYPE